MCHGNGHIVTLIMQSLALLLVPQSLAQADVPAKPAVINQVKAQQRLRGELTPAVTPIGKGPEVELSRTPLSALVPTGPAWLRLEANSEQRQPLPVGASPREQVLKSRALLLPRVPQSMQVLAESQLRQLQQRLHLTRAQFEMWPTQNDVGRLTWVVSRFRTDSSAPWQWLSDVLQRFDKGDANLVKEPAPVLPTHLSLTNPLERSVLLDDFFQVRALYQKPRFSECVWVSMNGNRAFAAWRPSTERLAQSQVLTEKSVAERLRCIALPPPARLQQKPVTFVAELEPTGKVVWQTEVAWLPATGLSGEARGPLQLPAVTLPTFPASFVADYRADLRGLSGAAPLKFPRTGETLQLSRKNSADPEHQLSDLLRYLEARYEQLGLKTHRQAFVWRGIPQSNLIAVLPGQRKANNRPILLADHIDTAISEDHFLRTGQRISTPGADDNVTAVAALLQAAAVLKPLPREHDIWLVHLTGEEFPADDLGARRLVESLLSQKQDLTALLLMDMLGYNPRRERKFQLNVGGLFETGAASVRIGQLAQQLTARVAPLHTAQLLGSLDLRNYLYNTDGLVFAENGFPVLFFNEQSNRYTLNRAGYHDTRDTVLGVDADYAASIAKVAIATAAVLAQAVTW